MLDERCLWQNGIDLKLSEHHERLEDHHRRIEDLTVRSAEQVELLEAHRIMLVANADHMKKIADNTDEMVDIFKGAKAFRKFAFWLVPLIATLAAVWGAIKYFWGFLIE